MLFEDPLDLFGFPRDRTAPKEAPRNVKNKAVYCPLADALQFKWSGLSKRQTKEVNPALFFGVLGESAISESVFMTDLSRTLAI